MTGHAPMMKVLLVDDDEESCELFQLALQRSGHDVVLAGDAESALTLLEASAFDVAVVDISLPGMDGYAFARLARERMGARAPALIAMTGYGRPQDVDEARVAGFNAHLTKPVELVALNDALALVMGGKSRG